MVVRASERSRGSRSRPAPPVSTFWDHHLAHHMRILGGRATTLLLLASCMGLWVVANAAPAEPVTGDGELSVQMQEAGSSLPLAPPGARPITLEGAIQIALENNAEPHHLPISIDYDAVLVVAPGVLPAPQRSAKIDLQFKRIELPYFLERHSQS